MDVARRPQRARSRSFVKPLVDIRWGTGSYFSDRWRTIDDALGYLLAEFPEFATDPVGHRASRGPAGLRPRRGR